MGKVLLAALVAGIVSALVTSAVLAALARGERAGVDARIEAAERRVEEQRGALDVAMRHVELLKRRVEVDARERAGRAAVPDPSLADGGAPVPPPPAAPDGTPYVSRAELEKALREHVRTAPEAAAPAAPVEKKTLEEVARDMDLSAAEEAAVRDIVRNTEEEFLRCLFGERPVADVAAEFRAAKDDPDRFGELTQDAVTRAFANLGKLMTLERRTRKQVEGVLGKERAKEFLATPRKPVLDADLEGAFEGIFDD